MLDEVVYAEAQELCRKCVLATEKFRERWNATLKDAVIGNRMIPLLESCERVSGFKETNSNAIMHHRLAQYGPPCKRCGKPLRTPQPKLCGACIFPVQHSITPRFAIHAHLSDNREWP